MQTDPESNLAKLHRGEGRIEEVDGAYVFRPLHKVYEVEDVLGKRVIYRLKACLEELSAIRAKLKGDKLEVIVPVGLTHGVRFSDGAILHAYSNYTGRRILAFRVIERETTKALSVDKRPWRE